MQFSFGPLTEADLEILQTWHYQEPYAVYDVEADPEDDAQEMLDPRSVHFAVRDEQNTLAGYFGFGTCAQPWSHEQSALYSDEGILDIGLGMRPDVTGQGYGLAFVEAGLAFAREQFAPQMFRLYVLTFNKRAIRVYERAGFARVRIFVQHNMHGEMEFLEMNKAAQEYQKK